MIDLDVDERNPRIRLHRKEDFAHMHKAGRLAAECLDVLVAAAQPGVTTARLDDLCVEFARDNNMHCVLQSITWCAMACRMKSLC
jgi:methionyl aminopeptidase